MDRLEQLHSAGLSLAETPCIAFTDEPKFAGFDCRPSQSAVEKYPSAAGIVGHGLAIDEFSARLKAVAELIERLCLFHMPARALTPCVYAMGENFVDPCLFLPRPDERFVKAKLDWTEATDLATGQRARLPAQLIWNSPDFEHEPRIRLETNSSGCALAPAGSGGALQSALFEAIERDAALSAYLTRRPLRRIVALSTELSRLVEYLERYALEPHIFDATTDLVAPTVLVITIDRSGIGPAVNVGSATAETYGDAVRHALVESLQSRSSSRLLVSQACADGFPEAAEVATIDDRNWFWYDTARIDELGFWLLPADSVEFRELEGQRVTAADVIEEFRRRGFEAFAVDLTVPEARQAGWEAIKIVSPDLLPLYLSESAKMLFSRRHGRLSDDRTLSPHPFN